MTLTDLQQHIYAYYVAGDASQFSAAPRFYPYGELVLILEDKIQVATRKFGRQVKSQSKPVSGALLDDLIAAGVYSTKQNEFGGSMHQFQGDAFRAFLKQQQDSNPIIAEAKDAGPEFWDRKFAELTSQ